MTHDEFEKEFKERLKAYFTSRFIGYDYDVTEGGCPTCGYGGTEAMSLKKIRDEIDRFDFYSFEE